MLTMHFQNSSMFRLRRRCARRFDRRTDGRYTAGGRRFVRCPGDGIRPATAFVPPDTREDPYVTGCAAEFFLVTTGIRISASQPSTPSQVQSVTPGWKTLFDSSSP